MTASRKRTAERRTLRCLCAALLAVSAAVACAGPPGGGDDRIRVSSDFPRYWEYRGRPVLLLGGSDDDNLFNQPDLMRRNLDLLARVGGNYIRATLSSRDPGNVWPYLAEGGRYDLDRFNPEYFRRLEETCRQAAARGIIVQIECWATFDFYRDLWIRNPFNPANNGSYSTQNTRLEAVWDHHPARRFQPFFTTPPALNDDRVVRRYQEAFVRKVLDVTLPFPNVLYCLDNETNTPPEWARYWGAFIRDEARRRGVDIPLTEMWDAWDISNPVHATTYRHPALFVYTDVSQNNWQDGQTHYDRLLWYRRTLSLEPGGARPMNNVKVYARRSGGRPNHTPTAVDRWWQNVFAGCASTRFHRPPSGPGLDETAQRVIRAARTFTTAFSIFECAPAPEILSDREDNEAYCLANRGWIYALYFPAGGQITLAVHSRQEGYTLRWFDPATATFEEPRQIPPGPRVDLRSPSTGRTWLVLLTANA